MSRARMRGFSLVEILVAVAVFAVVAALAWGGLDTLARARHALDAESAKLESLSRALGRVERDLRQALARPARAEGIAGMAALWGEPGRFEVTVWLPAGGWSSPAPELQRVAWSCDDGTLRRLRFATVDRTAATPRETQDLLEGISDCRLRYYPDSGPPVDRWPRRGKPAEELPRAVELSFVREGEGEFRRLLELPANPDPAP